MREIWIVILFGIFVVASCTQTESIDGDIAGNWYYYDTDSAYIELYFSEELFVYNGEGGFVSPVYFYRISNDSILFSADRQRSNSTFLFKISSIKDKEISISDPENNNLLIRAIDEKVEIWNTLNLGEQKNQELIKGWYKRNNGPLLETESNHTEDSLLIIPPVEKYSGDTIVN